MSEITPEQLLKFRDIIFNYSGLWFNDSKLPILTNRIKTRLKESGKNSTEEYLRMLSSDDDRSEMSFLINLVTTNETYFYRCESQMDSFRDIIIPKLVEEKIAKGDRKIRIWCAGCSTGEEPYTFAMMLMEFVKFISIWKIEIYATDISTEVLSAAMEGVYNKRSVEKLPGEYIEKYFNATEEKYIISNVVKKYVEFEYTNLVDSYYESGFDIIFCRNVLIYFKDETKKDVLSRFHGSLNDSGYMILGPTESIRGLVDGFKLVTLKDCVAFQKVPR